MDEWTQTFQRGFCLVARAQRLDPMASHETDLALGELATQALLRGLSEDSLSKLLAEHRDVEIVQFVSARTH